MIRQANGIEFQLNVDDRYWSLGGRPGNRHAALYTEQGKEVIKRRITDDLYAIALNSSIDVICFAIFGRHGRCRLPKAIRKSSKEAK